MASGRRCLNEKGDRTTVPFWKTIRTKIKEVDFYDKVNKYLTDFNIYNIMTIDINSVVTLNILNWKEL